MGPITIGWEPASVAVRYDIDLHQRTFFKRSSLMDGRLYATKRVTIRMKGVDFIKGTDPTLAALVIPQMNFLGYFEGCRLGHKAVSDNINLIIVESTPP